MKRSPCRRPFYNCSLDILALQQRESSIPIEENKGAAEAAESEAENEEGINRACIHP